MGRGEDARIEFKQLLGGVMLATLSVLYPSLNYSLYNLPLMGKGDRRLRRWMRCHARSLLQVLG